jgi:hypothetical protein
MAYQARKGVVTRRRMRRGARVLGMNSPQPMGDALSSIIGDLGVAASVATDPYFPEVICRIGQVQAVRANKPKPPCSRTPLGLPGGVGLGKLILPLRGFVYAEQYPILYPLAAFVLIGIPFLIGYQWGRTEG